MLNMSIDIKITQLKTKFRTYKIYKTDDNKGYTSFKDANYERLKLTDKQIEVSSANELLDWDKQKVKNILRYLIIP